MNESKRFEKFKSDITDYRIYDNEKEDAYFIDCEDESTVDAIVNLLNSLSKENKNLKKERILLEYQLKVQDRIINEYEKQ